jgi:glycosyltransferase involved in cell wall biosynthesis
MTRPWITIVTPVYNCDRWIADFLSSVKNQTMSCEHIELILIDDGSTDATLQIAEFFKRLLPRLKIESLRHTGRIGDLRNRGIEVATGEYLLFVDADDLLGSEAAVRLVGFAEESKADIVAFPGPRQSRLSCCEECQGAAVVGGVMS